MSAVRDRRAAWQDRSVFAMLELRNRARSVRFAIGPGATAFTVVTPYSASRAPRGV